MEYFAAFRSFLNGRHGNMFFRIEREKQNRMSFINVQVIREDKTFTTSVYRKTTFIGVYTHFNSFLLPSTYMYGTGYTLAYRC